MPEPMDSLPTTFSDSSASLGASASASASYYTPTTPPQGSMESGGQQSQSRLRSLLNKTAIFLCVFALAGAVGASAMWVWARFAPYNTTEQQSIIMESSPVHNQLPAEPNDFDLGDMVPNAQLGMSPSMGTGYVRTPDTLEAGGITTLERLLVDESPKSKYDPEQQLISRMAFTPLRNYRSLRLPPLLSPVQTTIDPCYMGLDKVCIPSYSELQSVRAGESTATGQSGTASFVAVPHQTWEWSQDRPPNELFAWLYGWVPDQLVGMTNHYRPSLQYGVESSFAPTVAQVYTDSLDQNVNPVWVALWLDQVYLQSSNYGFVIWEGENLPQLQVNEFAADWRWATQRFQQPDSWWNVWQKWSEPVLMRKLRAADLDASPAALGLIYASYQHLHPELVERLFSEERWLDTRYSKMTSIALHPQSNAGWSLDLNASDIDPESYFATAALGRTTQPSWLACQRQSVVTCAPESVHSLLQPLEEAEQSVATGTAQRSAIFPAQSAEIEFTTDLRCHSVLRLDALCQAGALIEL